jgi:hypothetical protein
MEVILEHDADHRRIISGITGEERGGCEPGSSDRRSYSLQLPGFGRPHRTEGRGKTSQHQYQWPNQHRETLALFSNVCNGSFSDIGKASISSAPTVAFLAC